MIGLIIISHYGLAREFQIALEHICGAQKQFAILSILPDDTIEMRIDEVLDAIRSVNEGQGVLLLTDLFGATPSNIALSTLDHRLDIEIIAGINLPMLVKLAYTREKYTLDQLVKVAKSSGQNNICSGKDVLCRYTENDKKTP